MSRDETLDHQSFGLSGRVLCLVLFWKYVALTAYGSWAAIVELPTFVIIGGSLFATAWACFVAFFAGAAAIGVARTWTTGLFRLEKWSTITFVCVFVGYSFALAFRSFTLQDWDSAPLAIIPLALCILPVVRWLSLVIHGRDVAFTLKKESER